MSDYSNSPLRSNLGRVRALGSAHHGARHWWLERVVSVALVPLSVWFVVELVHHLIGASRAQLQEWIANPFVALALAALTVLAFVHTRLGLQVVIEDYVHTKWKEIALILFKDACVLTLMFLTLAAIAKLHFIGL